MGGAGKKLQGGGARAKHRSPAAQVSDGYGPLPHPLRLIPGQIFFPRSANGRRRLFSVVRVDAEGVRCQRLDGRRERFTVSTERLLDPNHYIFQGYRPRQYRTWALVVTVRGDAATVVVPEWHPERPVTIPARALPPNSCRQEGWLTVTADLSAPHPARLRLIPRVACQPPPTGTLPASRPTKPAPPAAGMHYDIEATRGGI